MQIHAIQTLTVTLISDSISGSPAWLAPLIYFLRHTIHIHDILLFVCHLQEAPSSESQLTENMHI